MSLITGMGRSKTQYPTTPVTRLLINKGITFSGHVYLYGDHGGTELAATLLRVSEHAVIKTLPGR